MDLCANKAPDQTEIRQNILDILQKQFDISPDKFQASDGSHFWGVAGPLDSYEMVYLVYILEDKYGISFSESEFDDPRFYTLDGLAHIIEQMHG